MENSFQAILDKKIEQSCEAMRAENSRNRVLGSLETAFLLAVLGVFFAIVYFIFWGPGYSIYAKEQHDYTVSLLEDLPGPHRALVKDAMENQGYVSLLGYRKYVEMANDYKKQHEAQISSSTPR